MPSLTVQVKWRGERSSFNDSLNARMAKFAREVVEAKANAARTATQVSRQTYVRKRPRVGPRAGRRAESMLSFIDWKGHPANADVFLNVKALDQNAPHWIIQEIGTEPGARASLRVGQKRGVGRPAGQNVRTVKSQVGRKIPRTLVWAEGGKHAFPRSGPHDQQLHLASQVEGVPFRRKTMKITKEIEGQHFIRAGSDAGFRQYRTEVLAAAREAFRKGRSS